MDAVSRLLLVLLLLSSTACELEIGEDEGGEGEEDEGPYHRPGQACLACHGEFTTAGTVYLRATDSVGVEGAEVVITDATGWEIRVPTNRAGNFMVEVKGDREESPDREKGELKVPRRLDFPISVRVIYGDVEQVMRSRAHREGSCAVCHDRRVTEESVGRIYVLE